MIIRANHEPAAFIRVSQDTIININEVKEINRYYSTTEFDEWLIAYNTTMDMKINQYFLESGIDKFKLEEDKRNELIYSLKDKYDYEIRKKIGPKPELYVYSYYLTLLNNATIQISKRAFFDICKKYDIDPERNVSNPPENSMIYGDMSIDDRAIEETYNNI